MRAITCISSQFSNGGEMGEVHLSLDALTGLDVSLYLCGRLVPRRAGEKAPSAMLSLASSSAWANTVPGTYGVFHAYALERETVLSKSIFGCSEGQQSISTFPARFIQLKK